MKTLIRLLAWLVGTLLLLSIMLSLAVTMLIDPNDYRDEIAAAVTDATGRKFTIEGDLSLKTFPCCGIVLGPVALGNPAGFPDAEFARVARAAVDIQIWPLIARQELRAGEIELTSLDLRLVSRADGAVNWDFAAATDNEKEAGQAAEQSGGLATLDIAGVLIRDGQLSYRDEATGETIALGDINVSTGAISDGEPVAVKASLIADGLVPDIRVGLDATAQLTLDTEQQLLDLSGVTADIELAGDELPGGKATLAVALAAVRGLGGTRVPVEGLQAELSTGTVNLQFAGTGALVNDQPEMAGTVTVARFSPRELLTLLGEPPMLTADPAVLQRYEMQGDWSLAGDKAAIENILATLDDSKISGKLRVTSLATSAVALDLQIDDIDLDRYMAPAEEGADGAAASASTGDESLDLPVDELRELNLQGRIGIGRLKFADARLSDVQLNINAKNGLIRLYPLTAKLYGGSYAGNMQLDVSGRQPQLSVDENLTGIQIAALLTDVSEQAALSGTGNALFKARATGDSMNELLANLSGDTVLALQDGAYQGVDLWYEIRKARALLKKEVQPVAPENPYTDISQLKASANFKDGMLTNDNFTALIPFIRLGGRGSVNLLSSTLDYRLEARVVQTPTFDDAEVLDDLNGLVLPITLKGNMDAPKVGVDLGAIATSIGERKLREKLRKKLGIEEPAPAASTAAPAAPAPAGDTAATDAAPAAEEPAESAAQEQPPSTDARKEARKELKKSLYDLLGN